MPSKKAPKKPAKPAPAKKKPAPTRPAPKAAKMAKAAKPAPKKTPTPKKAKPVAAEVTALRERLAAAEAWAARVVVLEAQVFDLTGQLDGANAERQSAMERLADLEERLAESAAASPQSDDTDQRVAEALAEKAGAVRRAWELERDLEAATANLERERAAHAEARARLASTGATPAAPSPADGQLRHRIAELEHALADREEEVRRLLPPEAGDLITCPRCAGKMVEFEHLGVTLDRCTACAGLFFDSGELQEVLRREYPEPDVETETMVAVITETTGGDDAPRKKGFFRSLFGRKD